jgi:hypothetical protein
LRKFKTKGKVKVNLSHVSLWEKAFSSLAKNQAKETSRFFLKA